MNHYIPVLTIKKLYFILILLTCFLAETVYSQNSYYSWGCEPTKTQWKQINTTNFQVIYPTDFDSIAQDFSKKLNYIYSICGKSLSHNPRKISVILHTQTNTSNGSVIWCPKQMDIYTIPSQDQHAQEWYENLALHEFRHVVQIDKLNQGITRILYFLLGEQAIGAVSGIYLPFWLLEGDAVCTETAFSNSGRGRQADFSMPLRAQCYDKGLYSYSKAYFGSYKDFVPNYYSMGYFLLANSRKYYGQHLESDIIQQIAKHPFSIRPVNRAIKNRTNMSKREWYSSIFEKQANEWQLQHDREIQTRFDTITKKTKVYTNYINGFQVADSIYFAERKGLDKISQLIVINKGKEHVIANTGFKPTDERIQSNGKSIVWVETKNNIRWELKESSVIYIYNIKKEQRQKIRTKKHVFAPAISPSDERIVAAEVDEKGNYFLTFFDKQDKCVIKQIQSPNHDMIIQPSWNKNGSKIIFVGLNSKGKRIIEYDVLKDSFIEILPYSQYDYTSPQYWSDRFILFTSSYSGCDNIYAYDVSKKQTFRITVSDFGNRFPSTFDSTMVFSNYTSDGYILVKTHLYPEKWHNISVVKKDNYNLSQMLTNQEGAAIDFSKIPDTTFASKRYSKILHAINIHSWMPFYLDYTNSEINDGGIGAQILSQNHLGTTITSIGYRQSKKDATNNGFFKLTYKGLFPVFEIEYNKGEKEFSDIVTIGTYRDTVRTNYSTNNIIGRMYVPLNFSSKSYSRQITLNTQVEYLAYKKEKVTPNSFYNFYNTDLSIGYIAYTIYAYNIRQQSTQELNPRFGQKIFIGYEYAPFNTTTIYDDYAFAEINLYFPGIKRSHSLAFYNGYEWNKSITNDNFSRQISLPRGYTDVIATRKEMISFRSNYSFPLFYPDLELGNILYLKRIRCNMFADYAQTINSSTIQKFISYGAEISTDSHLFNLITPINIGCRISYLPQEQTTTSEFLFSINFNDI